MQLAVVKSSYHSYIVSTDVSSFLCRPCFQPTFHYDSNLWSNKIDCNLPGGETGLDARETKLPTYWKTPFSKICLGMRIGSQTHFILIYKHANSLFSLIADGKYRATSLGRNAWKNLLGSQSSLQHNCNLEGFNSNKASGLESVFLVTTKTTAIPVILGSGLAQEEALMTPTPVETRLHTGEITGTSTSKSMVISWFRDNCKLIWHLL